MSSEIYQRFNITVSGQGEEPMLFIHGLGCDQVIWRKVVPAFTDDYKVILMDLIGSGKSDNSFYNPQKYHALDGYADDVITVIEALQLTNVVLVCHSVGCMIGVLAAKKIMNRIKSIIMIGPSPKYIDDGNYKGGFAKREIDVLVQQMKDNLDVWASNFSKVVVANADQPYLASELKESICKNDPVITKDFVEATFYSDNREDLSAINVPVLIIQCSEDVVAPEYVGRYVHEMIKGSSFKMIDATGHCPHMSAPGETIEAIKEFLVTR